MSDKDNNLNPDWNGEDENAAGADSTPDWLQDFAVDEDAPAQPAEDVPEWLAALGPNYVQPESADAEQHHTPDDAGESDVADVADESAAFAWSAQVEDDDAGEPAAVPNQPDDFPAWLQSETTDDSGSAAQDLNPDWLSDFQSEADLQPEAESGELAQSEDIPDWLSELQPPEASSAPAIAALDDEDEQDESFGWIDQMIEQAESGGEAVQQPAASADSEIEPAEPPAWLPDFASDEEPAEDEPAPVELEMPDWLNDLAEAEPAGEPLSESADEVLEVETFEWASEAEPAEEQDVVAPAASLETEAADEEPEPEPAAQSDTFSWSNTFDTTAPMAPVDVEDDTPDWLKDFQTEDEVVDTTADESTVVTVQPGEQPEWLSEALATDEEAAEPEAVGSAFDEFDFEMAEAADEPPVAETEAAGAGNAPDWLNAMVPGVDLDYTPESDEVAEPEPVAPVSERRPERDFEWLVDIVEEETQPSPGPAVAAEPEAPRFSFSKLPAWLRGKQASAGDSSD